MNTRIVLLGPPASGKGTQAEMIRRKYAIETASLGAMLRKEKEAGTPLGIEADMLTRTGRFAPDIVILQLVQSWLEQQKDQFVFDGFPRTVSQAEAFAQLLSKRGTPLEAVIALDADLETIEKRILNRRVCSCCGAVVAVGLHVESAGAACPHCSGQLVCRQDDTLETLRTRMEEYDEKSAPLIPFYEERGILNRVDATRSADSVFAEIVTILEK